MAAPRREELLRWLAWLPGDEDESVDERWREYREHHLPALLPSMSQTLREFATLGVADELLHDAFVMAIDKDAPGRWGLTVLCPNSRGDGPCRLTIVLQDAELLGRTHSELRSLTTDVQCGLDYVEFDRSDDARAYEMRISCWDQVRPSFGFRFRDLAFAIDALPAGSAEAEAKRRGGARRLW